MALIDDLRARPPCASTPSRLLILYRTNFETLVEGDRGIAIAVLKNLLRMLAAYVRHTNALLAQRMPPEPVASEATAAAHAGVR
jgi:CRP-like cAMP-binding protein